MKIIHQKTKTLKTRDNGRSADAIAPNLIYGYLERVLFMGSFV